MIYVILTNQAHHYTTYMLQNLDSTPDVLCIDHNITFSTDIIFMCDAQVKNDNDK
jgi:hypothetical protein